MLMALGIYALSATNVLFLNSRVTMAYLNLDVKQRNYMESERKNSNGDFKKGCKLCILLNYFLPKSIGEIISGGGIK